MPSEKQLAQLPDREHYDMDDDESDLAIWPKLKSPLLILREALIPIYLRADAAAIRRQKRHACLILLVAVFGTLAVLCAVGELSDLLSDHRHWLSWLELLSATIALIVVSLGTYSAMHPDWLLQRFLAEQCRFVKFFFLLNPTLWYNRTEEEIRSSAAELSQYLHAQSDHVIREWVTWRMRISKRFEPLPFDLPDEEIECLAKYYKLKRLTAQITYFRMQAERRRRWERWTRFFSPICFFLSILAAFAHFVFEWLAGHEHEGELHTAAGFCILLAAALPVLAMGVRTIRTAHEFGRNHLRFEGMAHFMEEALKLLEAEKSPKATMALLRETESALESEHRAWLRLMLEAEWFG